MKVSHILPYFPGQVSLPNEASPHSLNQSLKSTADVEVREGAAESMIVNAGWPGRWRWHPRAWAKWAFVCSAA